MAKRKLIDWDSKRAPSFSDSIMNRLHHTDAAERNHAKAWWHEQRRYNSPMRRWSHTIYAGYEAYLADQKERQTMVPKAEQEREGRERPNPFEANFLFPDSWRDEIEDLPVDERGRD